MRRASAILAAAIAALSAHGFGSTGENGVAFHGSVQADVLLPKEDDEIGTGKYDRGILFNTYADMRLISRHVDAGARVEFMKWPLPGYEDGFAGWGLPNLYIKGRYKGFELTAGDFYEQFGAGFILRSYQERSLGIDNSLRGGRLKVTAVPGLRLTALGGIQRRYWNWDTSSRVYGADAELLLQDVFRGLRGRDIGWTVGLSYVLKTEKDQDIMVDGHDWRLNLPPTVSAFDARTEFHKGNFTIGGEFAWKGQDPSFDNGYTYGKGTALMLTASYSRSGLSALLQAKRSENMSFRSQRSMSGTSAFLNNMPVFTYLHTYALAAMYPYATQAARGEWAFQGQFAYNFRRGTPVGGRHGTKVKVNLSYIRGLRHTGLGGATDGILMGSDGQTTDFFGMGKEYYHDFNIQVEKKWSRQVGQTFMYMNQLYDKLLEGHPGEGTVKSHIFVLDTKWRISRRFTLRNELQYLHTRQDRRDWVYGLLELSIAPSVMVTAADMWNSGGTGTHYYNFGIAGIYRANRFSVSYGRTRAGFNCAGGVCRYVPATRGFQIGYNFTF